MNRKQYFAHRPWKQALLWLVFLAVVFQVTYNGTNYYTSLRDNVPSIVFAWEGAIPFLAWTIVPYWTIDALYGLSLFLCRTREELTTLGLRLLTASLLCSVFFVLFPLRCTLTRPESSGVYAFLFRTLETFDMPYNQAPSLHICLLVILWGHYMRHVPRRWLWLLHSWFFLIGVSILTTYQHHALDLATGILAGAACCYLVPRGGWQRWRPALPKRAASLALRYGIGAVCCTALALFFGGWGWLWLYPAFSLTCLAAGYMWAGPQVLQKYSGCLTSPQENGTPVEHKKALSPLFPADAAHAGPLPHHPAPCENGKHTWAATALLAPYVVGATLSRHYFLRRVPAPSALVPGLWIGGYPTKSADLPCPSCGVLDLCAEFPRARAALGQPYCAVPLLDLMPPTAEEIQAALAALGVLRQQGAVLVHCALGLTRSVIVAACFLVQEGHVPDIASALALINEKRPGIVIRPEYARILDSYL